MATAKALWVAAIVEAVSLAVLLLNLFTVHLKAVSSLAGPVHGAAYLVVIGVALLLADAPRTAKWLTLVPGIGGALALRRIRRDPPREGALP